MFFFVAYDGYRDRRQTESRLVSIPTLAQRNGDFSALPVLIYDPATTRPNPNGTGFVRDPFPGNIIPADRISPISRNFQSFLPDPSNAGLQNNYLGGSLPIGFNNDNVTTKVDLSLSARHQMSVLFAHGARRQHTPYRGGANAQTALPLPYTETRLVEEMPTTAQVKHTYVVSSRWVNQVSLGFARLSVPIFNATIDGRYPIAGRPARACRPARPTRRFPRSRFAGPNAPTQWRGTDARAFTEYLDNFTLQDNLQWTRGKHALTFGFQAQRHGGRRARAHVREPGDVRLQQRRRRPASARRARSTRRPATPTRASCSAISNATTVIEDSRVATIGRFYTYAFWVQDDFKVTPKLSLNLGLRYDIMKPYTEVEDRWSFMNPESAESGRGRISGRAAVRRLRARTAASAGRRSPPTTATSVRALGVAYSLNDRTVLRGAYGIMYSRRGAVGGRAGARNGTGTLGLLRQRVVPERGRLLAGLQLEQRRAVVPGAALLRSRRSTPASSPAAARAAASPMAIPEIGGRPPRYQNWNAGVQYALTCDDDGGRRRTPAAAATSSAAAAAASTPTSSIRATSCSATS